MFNVCNFMQLHRKRFALRPHQIRHLAHHSHLCLEKIPFNFIHIIKWWANVDTVDLNLKCTYYCSWLNWNLMHVKWMNALIAVYVSMLNISDINRYLTHRVDSLSSIFSRQFHIYDWKMNFLYCSLLKMHNKTSENSRRTKINDTLKLQNRQSLSMANECMHILYCSYFLVQYFAFYGQIVSTDTNYNWICTMWTKKSIWNLLFFGSK